MRKRGFRLNANRILIIAIGAVILLVAAIIAAAALWLKPAPPVPSFDAVTAHATWARQAVELTANLNENSKPDEIRAVREELLLLRVATQDRAAHLELILSLSALERGEAGAASRLHAVVEEIRP